MSTPEGRDQVPENLTPEGQAIVRRLDAVIAVLNSFSENQAEVNEAVSARLQQGAERLANQEVMIAELKELNAEARSRLQQGEERLANHDEIIADSRVRLQEGAERLANQEVMIAELKELNAEARSRLQRGDEHLASHDAMIAESRARLQEGAERLAKSELHLGYLRGAHASNSARRDADLIMLVRDADGQPAYIAVEASFTVAARDIERARRNTEYLHEFTGLKAVAAVAGVEITGGQRRNASSAGVHCYTIPARDLEAD